ncbi:unnamed protein product [Callosobruchus maculatus]|uniref:Uncharacterized protein n=1 Tax=Callosobruchus maculatus TaxID=64391 RepID=A0A653DCM9_CALMS|nr:unnamed protein product [Callosobruchus maculatus]VEN57291.1 unnamed protein product [Callosobruchus maculatus]
MNLSFFFVVFIVVIMTLTGQSEGKKFLKSLEKMGKNIGKAAAKALPIIDGYARVARDLRDL